MPIACCIFLFRTGQHYGLLKLFLLLVSIWPLILSGQHANISFEHYDVEKGLSAPVTRITQDNFGFLWFGTTDGLNRFDGTRFVVYRNIPGDTTSIPSNIINALHVDKTGRVWAATNGGLCYYDFADDRFHSISFNDTLETLDRHRVHAVHSTSDNTIWFATRTYLHQWKNGRYHKAVSLYNSRDALIKHLFIDAYDKVWVGSNEGLHMYDPATGQTLYGKIQSPFSIEKNLVSTIHPIIGYTKDTLLVGSWYSDLQKVYLQDNKVVSIPIVDNAETDPRRHIVSGIAPGASNFWWIGTYGNGLAWYDPATNQFIEHFHHNPAIANSLSSDYINEIYKDASGIIWIGTTKGLDKFDPLTQQFTSVSLPVPTNHFAVYRLVNTIVEDESDADFLWLCVSGVGLFHYDKRNQTFDLYQIEKEGDDHLLPNNFYSFYNDSKNRTWIGRREGLSFFNTENKNFSTAPSKIKDLIKGTHTILEDLSGNIWFATNSNGIYRFHEATNEVLSYNNNAVPPYSIPDNKVFCMIRDTKGFIWFGTQNRGLCRLDPVKNEYKYFENQKNNSSSIPDNGVYDLYEDDQGFLWLATENGLAKMDMNTFRISNFNTNNGLCNNTVFSITPDHNKNLWLGTNNGLSQLDAKAMVFRNYYMNDGLPLNRIDGEVYFASDSTLYLGTTGMLTFCHPDEMKINQRKPAIVITDFSILGKKAPVMRNAEMLQPIHLSYKQNMITFNFAALNFSNSFLNQYAYKLEGFDADWIYAGHNQSATYTNLNGGEYVFRVKGANNDGVWNETGTSVLLYVHPPFWRTWWFYFLCTIAIASILYLIYRFRINQILKLQSIRTRIARDLHDDIGSTLSSINMISSMADRTIVSEKKSNELFHTIAAASGQAMDLMSDIVWSINPKNDRMEMILIRMRQYASEILEAANISFTIEMNEEDKNILMPLEIRKDFFLIFKEAINNLAKYSKARHVSIRLNFKNQMICLSIEDDGQGFDLAQISSGNGLKNMKARASQLKGHVNIISEKAKGTLVDLKIPLTP